MSERTITGTITREGLRFDVAASDPHGIPAGGDEGQVLAKTSDANYAAGWVDPPEGGGGGGVVSVNGQTGEVVLGAAEVGAEPAGSTATLEDALGSAAFAATGDFAAANDTRLSDARTPTAHAASHGSGGGDAITVAQSQVTNLGSDLAAKGRVVNTDGQGNTVFIGETTPSSPATGDVWLDTSS